MMRRSGVVMSHCWDTHSIPGHGMPLEIAVFLSSNMAMRNPHKSRADILFPFADAVISHVLPRGPGHCTGSVFAHWRCCSHTSLTVSQASEAVRGRNDANSSIFRRRGCSWIAADVHVATAVPSTREWDCSLGGIAARSAPFPRRQC